MHAVEPTDLFTAYINQSSPGSQNQNTDTSPSETALEPVATPGHNVQPAASTNAGARTRRKRQWSREERAEHSVVEKKRREEHNAKLLNLAQKLPNMKNTKRINKGNVVQAASDHISTQRQTILNAIPDIRNLTQERDSILRELNELRAKTGLLPLTPTNQQSANLQRLEAVASETFPALDAAVFGGDAGDQAELPSTVPIASTSTSAISDTRRNLQPEVLPLPTLPVSSIGTSAPLSMPLSYGTSIQIPGSPGTFWTMPEFVQPQFNSFPAAFDAPSPLTLFLQEQQQQNQLQRPFQTPGNPFDRPP